MKNLKKLKPIAIATSVAVTLSLTSGCTVLDPYTGEEKTSKAVKYGAIGAVVCGIIGSTRNSKSARNAALGCGAIGAGVGAYMDNQEKELRDELAGTGVGVQRDGDQINLIMPGDITFETNRYDINGNFLPVLDSVSKVLYKFTDTKLEVAGFTDSTGSESYNQELSERRASSVSNYLRSRDVAGERLKSVGFGEAYPAASNDTESGRSRNRRVELTIIPIQPAG
ncbi:OmpA family protein [Kangiella sp. HZ709]|uniref:OmpA family protein n=1 Tax=Kangiella sp. HZ709 TaxID=2666328 RepID=UPI0012B04FDE|nr:OmpA family protein [Kangiella sp. HZ709]MRX27127.1 OmpA family protein [Kangiella sp. HZ709]